MRICCYFKPLLLALLTDIYLNGISFELFSTGTPLSFIRRSPLNVCRTCVHTRTQFVVLFHITILLYRVELCFSVSVNVAQNLTFHHQTQCSPLLFRSHEKHYKTLFAFVLTGNPITVNLRSFHYNSVTNFIFHRFH